MAHPSNTAVANGPATFRILVATLCEVGCALGGMRDSVLLGDQRRALGRRGYPPAQLPSLCSALGSRWPPADCSDTHSLACPRRGTSSETNLEIFGICDSGAVRCAWASFTVHYGYLFLILCFGLRWVRPYSLAAFIGLGWRQGYCSRLIHRATNHHPMWVGTRT